MGLHGNGCQGIRGIRCTVQHLAQLVHRGKGDCGMHQVRMRGAPAGSSLRQQRNGELVAGNPNNGLSSGRTDRKASKTDEMLEESKDRTSS